MRAPLAPPRLSEPRKVEAEAQAVETSSGDRQAAGQDLRLQRRDVLSSISGWSTAGIGSCQISVFLRHQRAEVARDRPHVAMGQLEPGAGEGVGELVGILVEAARDLLVGRVETQRQVGGQHGRQALLRRVEGVRDDRLGVLGLHCCAPAGLLVSSHSNLNRFSKK
jgi:hypothetical protein